MKYVKVREVEITRNNISARQFWSYCKRQLAKKGVNLENWGDWDSFVNKDGKYSWYTDCKHLDWDEPKNEKIEIKAYYTQLYLQDCYNFIIEYDTDFEWGYLYLVEWEKEEQEAPKEAEKEDAINDVVDSEESPIIVHEGVENGKVEYTEEDTEETTEQIINMDKESFIVVNDIVVMASHYGGYNMFRYDTTKGKYYVLRVEPTADLTAQYLVREIYYRCVYDRGRNRYVCSVRYDYHCKNGFKHIGERAISSSKKEYKAACAAIRTMLMRLQ